jgi:SnoaL-like domain
LRSKARSRAEIQSTLLNYAWAIDSKDWSLLSSCFTQNCEVSYGSARSYLPGGGAQTFKGRDVLVEHLSRTHQPLDGSLHSMSSIVIDLVERDRALARTYIRNVLVMKTHPDGPDYESAGYYQDELLKEANGWHINVRKYIRVWSRGNRKVIETR